MENPFVLRAGPMCIIISTGTCTDSLSFIYCLTLSSWSLPASSPAESPCSFLLENSTFLTLDRAMRTTFFTNCCAISAIFYLLDCPLVALVTVSSSRLPANIGRNEVGHSELLWRCRKHEAY
eukprot:1356216-Pleurochrysis_carterae.AAC.1